MVLCALLELFYLLDGLVQRAHFAIEDIEAYSEQDGNGSEIKNQPVCAWEWDVFATIYVEEKPY